VRVTYTRVFQTNPEALAQMLSLRLSGWRPRALAEKYQVDKTTIKHWCNKFNITAKMEEMRVNAELRESILITVPSLEQRTRPKKQYKYQHLFDEEERINEGKSYRGYVVAHQLRDPSYRFSINPYAPDPNRLN